MSSSETLEPAGAFKKALTLKAIPETKEKLDKLLKDKKS
ncbi:hypothetical protein MuYL_1676 [Mucilaginibacter xinganensis]|uniref:Uncharacterized protein n=1 Tax=Mucilaginibacter xinganensis TaxID=1234841 RepID=A0A223NUL4_9SPHI|nr:hypothetical protein MuYL_1676 [Mucilaginibacter xinganensis]